MFLLTRNGTVAIVADYTDITLVAIDGFAELSAYGPQSSLGSAASRPVNVVCAVTFLRADGESERWEVGGVDELIPISLVGSPVEEQLQMVARTAASDVVADLGEHGYRGIPDVYALPVSWRFGPALAEFLRR